MSDPYEIQFGPRVHKELGQRGWTLKRLEKETDKLGREVDRQKLWRWKDPNVKVDIADAMVVLDAFELSAEFLRPPEWRAPLLPIFDEHLLTGAT